MIILVGCDFDGGTVAAGLGASAYSYWFVVRAFRPVLERLGTVILVRDPAREVDAIARQFRVRGEDCLFLDFQPPNRVTLGLQTPTIPVYAWEFETLPDEDWRGDPRDAWAFTLAATGRAITHSTHAAAVTRAAMGPDYSVAAIPAPVWDGFAPLAGPVEPARLTLGGPALDTRTLDLSPWLPVRRRVTGPAPLPPYTPAVELDGVVYTTIFNPVDSRKNWSDIVAAFVWALRDRADATLVLKLTHADAGRCLDPILAELAKHTPFTCRVVLIGGFLDDADYRALLRATSFAVNASHGEGQCLPLMEYMSAGKPALAPRHTAMADYVSPANAFIVGASLEPCSWPQDDRMVYRTKRWRIDFGSLVVAFADSYRVATAEPGRYAAMARAATRALHDHCSQSVAEAQLRQALSPPAALRDAAD